MIVWQRAMDLVCEIYDLTRSLPKEEMFGLTSQIKRAAISIPSNIAEGYGRNSSSDYAHFLSIARGSKHEVETQLYICERLGYIQRERSKKAFSYCNEIEKMLNAMIVKLKT
ncbi:MAG: four helix bundle protein [Oscillospiraceae bacterium]|nr:four helix bundle protein [Oscillospiraceae bacterium]